LAIVIAVLACGTIGAVNWLVIGRLRVQPFIVTLASMIGVRGFAKWCTSNENVDIGFGDDVASRFASIFREKVVVIGTGGGCIVLASAVEDSLRSSCARQP